MEKKVALFSALALAVHHVAAADTDLVRRSQQELDRVRGEVTARRQRGIAVRCGHRARPVSKYMTLSPTVPRPRLSRRRVPSYVLPHCCSPPSVAQKPRMGVAVSSSEPDCEVRSVRPPVW